MTTRADKINTIIASRKPSVEHTEKARDLLRQLQSELENFSKTLTDAKGKIGPELGDQIDRLLSLRSKLNTDLSMRTAELNQLLLRFDRSTFNVGVTGNAGIGKSTLLQHLTGLPNDLIPARDPNNPMGGSCTGAPSVIVNNIVNDRIYADVEFYQESNFFDEIIKPYYQALNTGKSWLPTPGNFNNFANSPLPPLPADFDGNNKIRNIYDALKNRQEHAKQYQQNFGRRLQNVENTDLIRKYVAQKDKDNEEITDWIPVKMVTIYCPFKGKGGERITDRISVCDTPGLGDIGCKADDSLMGNIAENVDAVWMLISVMSNAQIVKDGDSALHTLLADAVPEWTPKDWVYGVLNKYTGTTSKQADIFREEMKKRYIEVRKIYDLDARQSEEVLEAFDATLDDIATNQQELDKKLYTQRLARTRQLATEVNVFANEARNVLPSSYGSSETGTGDLQKLFYPIWEGAEENLPNALNKLVEKYRENNEKTDPELDKKIDAIKDAAIAETNDRLNKITPQIYAAQGIFVYAHDLMHDLRTSLADYFDQLDENLSVDFGTLRTEVVNAFRNVGRLADLFPETDSSDADAWLRAFAVSMDDLINKDSGQMKIIINRFVMTRFSFRGYLLPKVRKHLNVLDDASPESNPFKIGAGDTLADLQKNYRIAFKDAAEKCAKELKALSADKNRALFAGIEQFCDGVLRTRGSDKAKDLWQEFYDLHKGEIWQDLFAKKEAEKKIKNAWNEHVHALQTATQALLSQIES